MINLKLVSAKMNLQNGLDQKCFEILNEVQKSLDSERKVPKQILSLFNEVWSTYHWQREHYNRCHQSLLSFLVYSDLSSLSAIESKEVIYRLILSKKYSTLSTN